jgi:predicted nucleotidyltransferase
MDVSRVVVHFMERSKMNRKMALQIIDKKYRIVIDEVKKVIHSTIDQPFELILYGSVARGEETSESDLDLLALIEGDVDYHLKELLWQLIYPIELEKDVVISLLVESKEKWETEYATLSMLYQNIQKEGIYA